MAHAGKINIFVREKNLTVATLNRKRNFYASNEN